MADPPSLPRLRQIALAARDLDAVAGELRAALGLGEPFSDPAVGFFGLRNAVFTLGDQFIEVVSPARDDTAAGRLIARRGGDCGYMVMLQVADLAGARRRAAELSVREVFDIKLEDIAEAHLHPADMRGAIVSVSETVPESGWRWGGPGWEDRSVPGGLLGASVAVREPDVVGARWWEVAGGAVGGMGFISDPAEGGLVEVVVDAPFGDGPLAAPGGAVELAGVRFVPPPAPRRPRTHPLR